MKIIISFLYIVHGLHRQRPLYRDDGELSLRLEYFAAQFVHRILGVKLRPILREFFDRRLFGEYGLVGLTLIRDIGGGVVLEGDLELVVGFWLLL